MAGRSFRNKSKELVVTGVKSLDRKIHKFGTAGANRIARAGLLAGARAVAKDIKKKIPARLKSVRRAIGHSVKKTKGRKTEAKAGAAVGKPKRRTKRSTPKSGGGVGISRLNVHWWFLGTVERSDRIGRNKGRMPKQDIIKNAFRASAIRKIIIAAAKKTLHKEKLKLKKKRRRR